MTRQDYYPQFSKAKSYYLNEHPPNAKPGQHWPYDAPVAERRITELLKDVVDPSTDQYYKGERGEEPVHHITQIVRLKTIDGREVLYSNGSVKFYTMYHDPVIETCPAPERHEHAIFTHKTMTDERDGHAKRFTTGIEEKPMEYDLEWSISNLDKLLEKKSPRGCSLTVKDELSGRAKECKDLEMFKSQSIDYILNDEWQTPEQRELVIREHEASTGKESQTKKR